MLDDQSRTIAQQISSTLVTGASGFVGRWLVAALLARRVSVRVLTRHNGTGADSNVTEVVGDLTQFDSLRDITQRIGTVFHLAGHAHAWSEKDDRGVHQKVTVEGTRNILRVAGEAGVRRLIFFSSVKAAGEGGGYLSDESSIENPITSYGRAKREAEELVIEAGRKYGMHVCNLRLSMVYGVGMKGNLPRMIDAIDRGRFPSLPDTHNKRSMVWVEDVVQAALLAAEKPEANGKTYIVTDGEAYSTRHIYEAIFLALGKTPPRWTIPMAALNAAAKIGDAVGVLRRKRFPFDSEALEKLTGSAYYSSAKIERELGFRPTKKLEDVLPDIISHYRAHPIIDR